MKPKYQHDCKWCEFIGIINGADVYICPQAGNPTIVVREGNKRENYFSGQKLVFGKLILTLNMSAVPL